MPSDLSEISRYAVTGFLCAEAVFIAVYTFGILTTSAQATVIRAVILVILGICTYWTESMIVPLCLGYGRPHWAAAVASLLWVQYLSASEIFLVSRVDAAKLPKSGSAIPVVGLLWNMRRVGTRWQIKNLPSTTSQSRTGFVLKRLAVTLVAYLLVDAVVSAPPPSAALVTPDKATLFCLSKLDVDDIIFRSSMTVGYWLTTGVLNLFMTNVGAISSVLLGLSEPADCPPLYGSFSEAYTVRRFWG